MDPEELLKKLQQSKSYSQKRSSKSISPREHLLLFFIIENPLSDIKESESAPELSWKKRRNEILANLQKIQGKEIVKEEKVEEGEKESKSLSNDEMLMNVELMNGELPKLYKSLLTRFKVADIFLRRNNPRMSKLTDIHNYMILSDCKLSFTEEHVQNIVYLYAFSEEAAAYIMGRTRPKLPTEPSLLTMKLPQIQSPKPSVKDQIQLFLGSARNLNGVFTAMTEEERKDILQSRYERMEQQCKKYIDSRYQDYLEREKVKSPEKGRAVGFTMKELGEMPLGEIPPPIVFVQKTARSTLEEMQRDVDKAVCDGVESEL